MNLPELLRDAVDESVRYFEGIVQDCVEPGESVLAFQQAETKPPFLVRIIPFIPDLIVRPKKFLLGLTERRLFVIRLTNPFNKLTRPQFKQLVAAIPLQDVSSVEPRTGLLTSSLVIRTAHGRTFFFRDMLRSAAESFSSDVRLVRTRCGEKQSTAFPALQASR